jgi:hypothetical protein
MSVDPEAYTGVAAKAISRAYELAAANGNIEVTPLHLASVLYSGPNQLGVQLFDRIFAPESIANFHLCSLASFNCSWARARSKLDPTHVHTE